MFITTICVKFSMKSLFIDFYSFIHLLVHSFIIYLCCLQVCQCSGLLRCFPKRAFYWRKFLLEFFSHKFDRAPSYTIRRLAL